MRLSQIPVGILFEGMENLEEGPFSNSVRAELGRYGLSPEQQAQLKRNQVQQLLYTKRERPNIWKSLKQDVKRNPTQTGQIAAQHRIGSHSRDTGKPYPTRDQ